jgi:hypothetical protein
MTTPQVSEAKQRANRENAKKSTGPRTADGKARSCRNALKHGLTATKVIPIDAPGESHDGYACRSTWKLDRIARFEDASAFARLEAARAHPDARHKHRAIFAAEIGERLMAPYVFITEPKTRPDGGRIWWRENQPEPLDHAPLLVRDLEAFAEGVAYLFSRWCDVNLGLTTSTPDHYVGIGYRLMGIRIKEEKPDVDMKEVAAERIAYYDQLCQEMKAEPEGRLDADLALFEGTPEAQQLSRYEAAAERELHRSIATLLTLRKHPELVTPAELAEAASPPKPACLSEVTPEAPAKKRSGKASKSTPPPVRNEPTASERLNPSVSTNRAPRGSHPAENAPR